MYGVQCTTYIEHCKLYNVPFITGDRDVQDPVEAVPAYRQRTHYIEYMSEKGSLKHRHQVILAHACRAYRKKTVKARTACVAR